MKTVIRQGVFETNSSSVHTICICTKEEYDKWNAGEYFYDVNTDTIIKPKVLDEITKARILENAINSYNKRKQAYWKEWVDVPVEDKSRFIKQSEIELMRSVKGDRDFSSSYKTPFELSQYYQGLAKDTTKFTTPSGDEMVAICYSGYDG